MSRGYSLPVGPGGEVQDGPLLDFTVQSPSWAWAAGALVSDLESNLLVAPDAVYEAFMRVFRELSFTHPSGGGRA
jgi:hypothetical protein